MEAEFLHWGDSVLAEFQSAVSAVICANEFQKLVKERNKSVSPDPGCVSV